MPDVVVVGAGIAGLVAARDLAAGGLSVTLLEATDRLGGKVARHTVGGIELDAGAESFATRRGTVAALAAELGLEPAIVQPNPAGAWLQPATGAALPLPKTALLGIPGTPLAADVIAVVGMRGPPFVPSSTNSCRAPWPRRNAPSAPSCGAGWGTAWSTASSRRS